MGHARTGTGDRAGTLTSVLAQPPTLDDVLSRLESYVAAYESRLSRWWLRNDTHRSLQIRSAAASISPRRGSRSPTSDLVFLRLPAVASGWGSETPSSSMRNRCASAARLRVCAVQRTARCAARSDPDHRRNTRTTWATTCWCARSRARWYWTYSSTQPSSILVPQDWRGTIEHQSVWKIDSGANSAKHHQRRRWGTDQLARGTVCGSILAAERSSRPHWLSTTWSAVSRPRRSPSLIASIPTWDGWSRSKCMSGTRIPTSHCRPSPNIETYGNFTSA